MNEADNVIRQNSRSFSLAASLLPKRYRRDVTALYAFCRTVDDTVDHADDSVDAGVILAALKKDIETVADDGTPIHPATQWVEGLIRERKIDPRHAIELIEGMEMDADGFRVRTDGDLRRYCYHAAGTVGLMMSQLMGVRSPVAKKHAVALGIAMQMTNIARDVREDALRGRCYLPRIESPLLVHRSEVASEVERVLSLAEEQYDFAIAGIDHLPRACRPAIRVALTIYRDIGREIIRQDCPVLLGRVVLPRWRLIVLAATAVVSPSQVFQRIGKNQMREKKSPIADKQSSQVAQARSSVCLGLSLTAIMAAVLFVLVYVNPKDASYGVLPLVYASVSLGVAVVMNRLSVRFEKDAESLSTCDIPKP